LFIFDFDGVICDSFETVVAAFQQITGIDPLKEPLRYQIDHLRTLDTFEAFQHLGIKKYQIPMAVLKLRKMMKTKIPFLKPVATIDHVLKTLHERKVKMSIVSTNSEENIKDFLVRNQIDYFDFIYSAGLFNKGKILKRIISGKNQDPKNVFYIGDQTRDIIASRQANVRSIAVTWGYNDETALLKHHPDYLIRTPMELLAIG